MEENETIYSGAEIFALYSNLHFFDLTENGNTSRSRVSKLRLKMLEASDGETLEEKEASLKAELERMIPNLPIIKDYIKQDIEGMPENKISAHILYKAEEYVPYMIYDSSQRKFSFIESERPGDPVRSFTNERQPK